MAARLPALWVIDELDIVHAHRCGSIEEPSSDYFPIARTATDLLAHLARPDSHERHQGPARIVPCDDCVVTVAEIEGASK